MHLDIRTLVFELALIYIVLFLAILAQYIINKRYQGMNYWLAGTASMALGYVLMPFVSMKSLILLAAFANPFVELGYVFLYMGLLEFLGEKKSKLMPSVLYLLYLIVYFYYIFIQNDITLRTIVVTLFIVTMSCMIVDVLIRKKDFGTAKAANFMALVFAAHGVYFTIRILLIWDNPISQNYEANSLNFLMGYIVPAITGILWTFGFVIMVNQRLNYENSEEKEKLRMLFNTSPDAELITSLSDGKIIDVNEGFISIIGCKREEVIGNTTDTLNIWHDISDRELFVNALNENGICENFVFDFVRYDKTILKGMLSARRIMIHNRPHAITVVRDITAQFETEKALRESEATYRSILEASPDDITITDLEGNILMLSPVANKLFGYHDMDLCGLKLLDFIIKDDVHRAKENILRMHQGILHGPNEYRGVHQDGSIFDIEVNSDLIKDVDGKPSKMVFIVREITERKRAETQIRMLIEQLEVERNMAEFNSITDSLTGLYNRRYFDHALTTEYFRLRRSGAPLSLIMLDVDHFKLYNDLYGHVKGDECLQKIGEQLKTVVGRLPDVVARYGGEEFIIILPETSEEAAILLAERVRIGIEALAIPHGNSEVSNVVTVSIGVSSASLEKINKTEQLVTLVDAAMYMAKEEGRNCVYVSQNS